MNAVRITRNILAAPFSALAALFNWLLQNQFNLHYLGLVSEEVPVRGFSWNPHIEKPERAAERLWELIGHDIVVEVLKHTAVGLARICSCSEQTQYHWATVLPSPAAPEFDAIDTLLPYTLEGVDLPRREMREQAARILLVAILERTAAPPQ